MAKVVRALSHPVEFEGKKIESLEFDYESLTGKDVRAANLESAKPGKIVASNVFDQDFCLAIAARAAKVNVALFDYLPAGDVLGIEMDTRNFLLTSGFTVPQRQALEEANEKVSPKQ